MTSNPSNFVHVKQQLLRALLLFIATVILAWAFDWDIGEIGWSLWIATFYAGILTIIIQNVDMYRMCRAAQADPEALVARGGKVSSAEENAFWCLFFCGLYAYILGGVCLVIGVTLNELFPLIDADTHLRPAPMFLEPTKRYWPFILLVLADAVRSYYKDYVIDGPSEDRELKFLMTPYYIIFTRQAIGVALMLIGLLKSPAVIYWSIIFLYFFPWKAVWNLASAKRNEDSA